VVFRGCRARFGSLGFLAVDRTRGRGGASFRGAEPQESNGPGAELELGRKLERGRGPRANGLSKGARLRSGRSGLSPASPAGWNGRRGRRAGQLVRRTGDLAFGGTSVLGLLVVRSCPSGEACVRHGIGAAAKPLAKLPVFRVGCRDRRRTRKGASRPPRGGTALREGKALKGESQGRLRHETRPRSFGRSGGKGGFGATRARQGRRG